jgi:hypothetical protein
LRAQHRERADPQAEDGRQEDEREQDEEEKRDEATADTNLPPPTTSR